MGIPFQLSRNIINPVREHTNNISAIGSPFQPLAPHPATETVGTHGHTPMKWLG